MPKTVENMSEDHVEGFQQDDKSVSVQSDSMDEVQKESIHREYMRREELQRAEWMRQEVMQRELMEKELLAKEGMQREELERELMERDAMQREEFQMGSKDGQEDNQRKTTDGQTFQPPDVNIAGETMNVQFTPLRSLGPLPFPGPQLEEGKD